MGLTSESWVFTLKFLMSLIYDLRCNPEVKNYMKINSFCSQGVVPLCN